MNPYRQGAPVSDDTEHRYRCAIAELCALLAREKLPGADGPTLVSAAMQIADGMCERFGLSPIATQSESEGPNG